MRFSESVLCNKNITVHLDHYWPLINKAVFLLTLERKPVFFTESKKTFWVKNLSQDETCLFGVEGLDYCEIPDLFPWDKVNPDEIWGRPLFLSWSGGTGQWAAEGEEEEREETTEHLLRSAWCLGRKLTAKSGCLASSSNFPLLLSSLWAMESDSQDWSTLGLTVQLGGIMNVDQLPETLSLSLPETLSLFPRGHNGTNNSTFLTQLWGLNEPFPTLTKPGKTVVV